MTDDDTLCLFPDRALIEVTGEDATKFLHGLVTGQVEKLATGSATLAGLLTPQGKLLFDFFLVRREDGYWLDCPKATAADFFKRLTMYKLRSTIALADVSEGYALGGVWGGAAAPEGATVYADPRLEGLGSRFIIGRAKAPLAAPKALAAYEALRIALAVPESGKDYPLGDTFPHDACFDLLNGVDFKKGCFVGQEVVSRMKHRGTARTRVVKVKADAALPQGGADIAGDGFTLGRLGTVAGNEGIALVRIDRAADAMAKGEPITVNGLNVTLEVPSWASYSLEAGPKVDA